MFLNPAPPEKSDPAGQYRRRPHPRRGACRFGPTHVPLFRRVTHRPVHFCGRQGKFGLCLNTQKTHLVACGKRRAWQVWRGGGRMPTVDFLGFTHDWGRSRSGKARLKRKTSKKRRRRAVVELNQWLRQERSARKLPDLWQAIAQKMRGHFNYFGVTDNSRALYLFEAKVHHLVFKWLNRRSQRRSFTWESFRRYFNRHPLP